MIRKAVKAVAFDVFVWLAATSFPTCVLAQNATIADDIITPYPTIIHLAVEWNIQGDDNLNGVVTVRFREKGQVHWREGLPLRRIPAGKSRGTHPIFSWKNKHSGSLFDLKPNTEYEIHLKLSDPDGGSAEKIVSARTRPVPKAPADAPTLQAQPGEIPIAQPGEIVLLAPGSYGSFEVPKDGAPGKPIVYRSVDGRAVFESVSLRNRKYVYLEGLTVKNPSRGKQPIGIDILGAEECTVRRCKVEALFGVRASAPPGARNCYIADNVVQGTYSWEERIMGARGETDGEGIEITGSGNVICFNRVTGFRDCLSTMEDTYAAKQVGVDFYNNDVYLGLDDGIEADFCMGNCRIVRNRLTNCFVGLSSQPGLGGPTYFIRNVMYNLTYVPFKLHRFSQGDICLHNTVVKVGDGLACFARQPFDYAFFRNNLCIGGAPGGLKWDGYSSGVGLAVNLTTPGAHCDIDYDAVGVYQMPFRGRIGSQMFASLDEMRAGPYEKHGMRVDMSVFKDVPFPERPVPELGPQDLRPVSSSPVVDAGFPLPNVNDEFLGRGPDIGAYEAGQQLPIYGPRPEGVDEETRYAGHAGNGKATRKSLP